MITIDGPAASGKSTLAFKLAQHLGYLYFDTGIMYRAVTWAVLHHDVPVDDEAAVTSLAEHLVIDVLPPSVDDNRPNDIFVEGLDGSRYDVTWEIRLPAVEANVSQVSSYGGVRRALAALQRKIGLRGKVVMVGRDIGTVVLPEADLKIYLDASAEERARRRTTELLARHEPADYETILAAIRERDRIDSSREVSPLRPAEDARILNSTDLDAAQVLALAEQWAQKEADQ